MVFMLPLLFKSSALTELSSDGEDFEDGDCDVKGSNHDTMTVFRSNALGTSLIK